MDQEMQKLEYENRPFTSSSNWVDQIDIACKKACQAIAPTWPLDQSIAVNPYWKRINRPLREVAARMALLGNISVFPPRSYIADAWRKGRINSTHLDYALKNSSTDLSVAITKEDCLAALRNKQGIAQFPLLIDVLDDDPQQHTRLSWRQAITHQVSQTCAAYFDTYQAGWHPQQEKSLYAFWRETLTHDHGIGILMGLPDLGKQLNALPATSSEAETWVINRLGIPETVWADYLEAVLLTVNGWASWCAYLGWQADLAGKTDKHLRELLAIRLAWGAILLQCKDHITTNLAFTSLKHKWANFNHALKQAEQAMLVDEIWQLALEVSYQQSLANLLCNSKENNSSEEMPEVQAAFCIDVRSEPFRRSFEQTYPKVQTIGFAGFFGLPVAYSPLGTTIKRPQLPGLLAPTMDVTEMLCEKNYNESTSASQTEAARLSRFNQLNRLAQWEAGSVWPNAAFSFVEATGFSFIGKLKQWIKPSQKSRRKPDLHCLSNRYREVLRPVLNTTLESKIVVADQVLHALGLVGRIAPMVLLVGHGSQSENNAHASALDCGACCGQTGEVNARVLAKILNDKAVREGLRIKDIHIPSETVFVAVLHNTTTDEIEAFDLDLLSAENRAMWAKVLSALTLAGDLTRRERAGSLDINPLLDAKALLSSMRQRANDGAQTRPEWGLVGNAAFIIAPRHRTKNQILNGRSFLHDYDATKDRDGSLLELLMTAPMIVSHWINWQYHASTSDPLHMGCGNKVLHNVVGGHLGVFEGNGGDLRIGLSKQSLHDGDKFTHEPLRLTVVIEASSASIERVINKHLMVKQLVEHGWLHLWRFEGSTLLRYIQGQWLDLDFVKR